MDNRQENNLSRHRATGSVLTDNITLFAGVPALGLQHQKLLDSVALVDSLAALQGTNTKGITLAKAELLRQMVETSFSVAGIVKAYASETGNLELKERVKLNKTMFHDARDDEKDNVAQVVYDAAQENVAALADYGVTAATLTGFLTRIDAYRLSIAGPATARSRRRSNTILLAEEFKRADMIADERLDGLMEQFKVSQPDFYNTYHAARKLIDSGHRAGPTDPPTP